MNFTFFRSILLMFLLMLSLSTIAQSPVAPVEMADQLTANGKIYIVIAVLCIIFAGIIAYLIRLERKVSALEKKQK